MKRAQPDTALLLTELELGRVLGLSSTSLRRMRRLRNGPKWMRLDDGTKRGAVRYREADVDAWLRARTVGGGT